MSDLDPAIRAALAIGPDALGRGSPVGFERVPDSAALVEHFATDLMREYRAAKAAGRQKVVFIVPVGPVGQFERWADACNREAQSLADLVLINMDEYLTSEGDFIPVEDPLSFRGHMQRRFWGRLDPSLAPPEEARIFPEPRDIANVPRAIAEHGGVDVCFGGVGITGHVAFNDPPEPGEPVDDAAFAALPTRIVRLSRETLTINAVTAARGNIARIPRTAVTVGMAEILAARRIRLYMNRPWQCAAVRRFLHGPVTAAFPVTLLRDHPDCRLLVTAEVTALPEPDLR